MKDKVLIVGDVHGNWSKFNRLIAKKRPDIVLQCGDFGWWPRFNLTKNTVYGRGKPWNTDQIKPQGASIYWVDGNHEEHPTLKQTGHIRIMPNGTFHCSRGSVLTLPDGRNILFIGGAASIDVTQRTPGHDWFPGETITSKNLELCLCNKLAIDIVISHTCPNEFDITSVHLGKIHDPSRDALSEVLDHFKPKQWFFGHWHKYKSGIHNETKWTCLDYPSHGGIWWKWL